MSYPHIQPCPSCESPNVFQTEERDQWLYRKPDKNWKFDERNGFLIVVTFTPVLNCPDCKEQFIDHRGEAIHDKAAHNKVAEFFQIMGWPNGPSILDFRLGQLAIPRQTMPPYPLEREL